jgi:hypothetical protein
MKRAIKVAGGYKWGDHVYKKLFGSRREVWNRTAIRTEGKLTLSDLMMNGSGEIVSKEKHRTAVKEQRLMAHGYMPGFATMGKKQK